MSARAATIPNSDALRIDSERLMDRIMSLAEISPIAGGGNCRLALTDDDKDGRDLVVSWMRDLNMDVSIDAVGNIIGVWNVGSGAPVMTGSHIDTVRTGGKYDGNYGVIAGLEVIETCQKNGFTPSRPLAVAVFTDEEGARFAPDMLGSLVYVGGMTTEEALDITLLMDHDWVMNSYGSVMQGRLRAPGSFLTRSLSCTSSRGRFLRQTMFGSEQLPECKAFLGKK